MFILHNIGTYAVTLKNNSGASSAANRFYLASDYVLQVGDACWIQYDDDTNGWRVISSGLSSVLRLAKGTSANIDANDRIATPAVTWLYLTSAAASDSLDSIGAGSEGQVVFLKPVAGKDITLVHDAGAAGEGLLLSTLSDFTLRNDGDCAIGIYDAVATKWNVLIPNRGKRQIKIMATDLTPHATDVKGYTAWEGGTTVVRAVVHYFSATSAAQTWAVYTKDTSGGAWTLADTISPTLGTMRTASSVDITLTDQYQIKIAHLTTPNAGDTTGSACEIVLVER